MTSKDIEQKNLINRIRSDLKKAVTEKSKKSFPRFFKEKILFYGVGSSNMGLISKKYFKEIGKLSKKDFFLLCEVLLKSDYCEEAFLVSGWAPKYLDQFKIEDLKIFKRWVSKYINNWAKCDGFCNHTIGSFIEKYPSCLGEIKSWANSKNIWMKRASAVSLIILAKNGHLLQDVFEISTTLLQDKSDMVQKGYGWLLKEASRKHQKEVFDFVIKNKSIMPRTALRYAIELMPADLKKIAMAK